MVALILLSSILRVFAGTAEVSFIARTNMPGVVVEGKSSEVPMQFDRKTPTGSTVEFDVFDLKTGMDKRDAHLREKVFSAKKNGDAKIRFEVLEFPASLTEGKGQVKGKLQIKDVTKEVVLPIIATSGGVSGKTTVLLKDFSLPRPSFMGVKVEDEVEVEFRLKE